MPFKFEFNKEKDIYLKETRGIGFEDIIEAIKQNDLVANIKHFNKVKYPNQKIYVVRIRSYIYAVPYIVDRKRKVNYLKTIYPSRKMVRKYLKK